MPNLNSSCLAYGEYWANDYILYLEFQNGWAYEYYNVHIGWWHALLDAGSHGRFFRRHIMWGFWYARV